MSPDAIRQDMVSALRGIRKSPGYSLIVILTLGLGIAANATIVSLMIPYLIRELPFEDPERLVQIGQVDPLAGWDGARFSLPQVRDWEERSRRFEGLATYFYTNRNLTGNEDPERVIAGVLSANMFGVLGSGAGLGRTFSPGDGSDVAVLSHGLWMRRYGGDPGIVGRSLRLDGDPFTVIGVMPQEFHFPFGGVKLWIPLASEASAEPRDRTRHILVGRMREGVSRERLREELEAVQRELAAVHPEIDGRFSGVSVKPMREALNFGYDIMKASFAVFLAAVSFVLLIACVNVASLTLARTSTRARETALRAALGAPRSRLVRELLGEGVLLALAGGALGVFLAHFAARAVGSLLPEDLFRVGDVRVDGGVLLFSMGVALLTPLVFALGPALGASRMDPARALQEGGRSGYGRAATSWRRGIVVVEVALAIVLVTATGLMVRSFLQLQEVDLGFQPRDVLTVEVTLPESRYPDATHQRSFRGRALEEVRSAPGVEAVGLVSPLPMNHAIWGLQFALPGDAPSRSEDWPLAHEFRVTPGYFEAMAIPILAGRGFEALDGPDANQVVVVSRSLAARFWRESPIGETLLLGDASRSEPATIVGVASDVVHDGFGEEARIQIYRSLDQTPSRGGFFVVRAAEGASLPMGLFVKETLARVDPELPLTLRPMSEIVGESTLQWSLSSLLLGAFGAIALALAALGIYGVISYSVGERRREIGLRMALGATRREVGSLVMREGFRLTGLGLAVGLALAALAAKLLASLLYEVGPFDPTTFGVAVGIFLSTAAAESLLPAARASRTDPICVLRHE